MIPAALLTAAAILLAAILAAATEQPRFRAGAHRLGIAPGTPAQRRQP